MFFVCAVRKDVYDKAKQAYEGNDKISEAEIGSNGHLFIFLGGGSKCLPEWSGALMQ